MANMCRQHLFELDFFLSRDITFDFTSIITTIHCSGGSGDEVVDSLSALCLHDSHLQPLYRKELMRYVRDVEEEPNLDHGFARLCLAAEKRFCQRVPSSVQQILSHSDYDTVLNKGVTLNSLKLKCLVEHKTHPDLEP
ncbi:hypothetical protein ECG_03003 [Echinococcus granulosus]|nr:hypothetical protein ECG_03003 [Echinococcus granulosus]